MAVTLYRQLGKGKARRYKRVNLGPGRRPADLAGPYFLRYTSASGTRPWEPAGYDPDAAIEAQAGVFRCVQRQSSCSTVCRTKRNEDLGSSVPVAC